MMEPKTKQALVDYVIALFDDGDGEIKAIHVTEIIPFNTPMRAWTQFVDIDQSLLPSTITYDQPSGWFKRVIPQS